LVARSQEFLHRRKVLSGLATGASWLCYFRALQLGDSSQVAPVDKLSIEKEDGSRVELRCAGRKSGEISAVQAKHTTTVVRKAMATFESTCSTSIFARIAVKPAKNAEASVRSNQFITG
jgi:hypothetical protein